MVEFAFLYIAVLFSIVLIGQLYIALRKIEYSKSVEKRCVRVAIAWPLLAIAGFAYFMAIGIIYAAEGSFQTAQQRLESRTYKLISRE